MNALNYGYSELLPDSIAIYVFLVGKGYAIMGSQFVILPMMLCGAFLAWQNEKQGFLQSVLCLALSFVLLVIEACVLKYYVGNDKAVSYIFMILPTAYFLFVVLLEISGNVPFAKMLGKMSLIIYCVHPMFCWYIGDVMNSSILCFVIVSVVSCIVSFVWVMCLKQKNK